jgi:Transposase, Mutator family
VTTALRGDPSRASCVIRICSFRQDSADDLNAAGSIVRIIALDLVYRRDFALGDRLFTFTRLPPTRWRSARTTNAIERLHEEFKRRIKTQTVLPSADTAAMLFWALLASGQINMQVDGWQTLHKPIDQPIDPGDHVTPNSNTSSDGIRPF